jgi:putative acetyltransferase
MPPDAETRPDPPRPFTGPPGLVIRAACADDAAALTALMNLPRYRAGTLRLPHQRSEQTRRWLENAGPEALNLLAELDGAVVGLAGLDRHRGRRAHAAGIGIGVHDDHRGHGIGSALIAELIDAADNWLGLRRLELTVYADNIRAIRLYERFGFEPEGIQRDYAFRAGRFVDVLGMARLRR